MLHGLSVAIAAGQWTSIVGPNGAASPRCSSAWPGCCPNTGTVALLGPAAGQASRGERPRQLAWLGQNEASADDLTVWDVAMLGRLPHQTWLAPASAR